jgi:hypothetical protein
MLRRREHPWHASLSELSVARSHARCFDPVEPGRAGGRRAHIRGHVQVDRKCCSRATFGHAPAWLVCSTPRSRWHCPSSRSRGCRPYVSRQRGAPERPRAGRTRRCRFQRAAGEGRAKHLRRAGGHPVPIRGYIGHQGRSSKALSRPAWSPRTRQQSKSAPVALRVPQLRPCREKAGRTAQTANARRPVFGTQALGKHELCRDRYALFEQPRDWRLVRDLERSRALLGVERTFDANLTQPGSVPGGHPRDLRQYKAELSTRQKPASVNAALAALRRF